VSSDGQQPAYSKQSMLNAIGLFLGWLCAIIYMSSRIPQLKLMLETKKVDGLNPLFFFLTFSGNLTQCASMLVMPDTYHKVDVFVKMLPWLISSGLCMLQDAFILFLVFWYKSKGKLFKQLPMNNYGSINQIDTVSMRGEE